MTNNFDIREWRMKQLLKEAAFDPKKSDLNHDRKLSDYERARGMAIAKNMGESNQPNIDITTLFNNIFTQKQDIAKKYDWNSGRDIMFAWKQDPSGVKEVLRQGNTDLGPAYQRALDYYASQLKEQPSRLYHDATDLEEDDWKQNNDESDMAHSQLYAVKELADKLCRMIDNGEQLDAWVQAKLTKAEDYLDSVYHYLQGEEAEEGEEDNMPSIDKEVIVGTSFYEGRGDTDYRRAKAAKRFGKKGEQNTFGAGVKKGEKIEKQRLRK